MDEETKVIPEQESNAPEDTAAKDKEQDAKQEKTFTEAELNKILSSRIAQEREKHERNLTEKITEAEKLAKMNAEQKAEYEKQRREAHHPDSGDVCLIYDDYITDGGTLEDFTDIMVKVMVVSGFLKQEVADKLKAMQEAIAKNNLNILNQKTPQN